MEHAVQFVNYALKQEERSGTRNILRRIGEAFGAHSVVFYQKVKQSATPKLFALANWFHGDGRWSRHDLPLKPLTGWVIEHNQHAVADPDDPRINRDMNFVQSTLYFWFAAISIK